MKRFFGQKGASAGSAQGFTLVELAIVLVIIGLLLGAVLKGQELINSAKIKNVANQYKSLLAAVYGYQDKYGYLPGDDPQATSRLWATGSCWTTNGDGNGNIVGNEYYSAPKHLSCSGFISGSYNGTSDVMKHAYGGNVYVIYDQIQQPSARNLIRFDGLKAEDAQAVDKILDDGVYNQGTCRATSAYTAGTTISSLGCNI